MTNTTRAVTFEEWKDEVHKGVFKRLRVFPKEEVTAFLESEEKKLKEAYEDDKKSGVFGVSGIEYALSLMF